MSTLGESVSRKEPVRFAAYELRSEEGALFYRGRRVKLQPQPFRVLEYLVARAPAIVSREELGRQIWGPGVHVELNQSVNYCIRQVRQVLGDSATEPRFIETLPKLGYRFVGPIESPDAQAGETRIATEVHDLPAPSHGAVVDGGADSAPASPLRFEPQAEPAIPDRPFQTEPQPKGTQSPRLWVFAGLLVAAAALLAVGASSFGWRPWFVVRAAPSPIQSLAVIPLENLSGDPSQEYFADGMTDELITMLAKNSSLRVVSRTSAMQYKGARRPLTEIAKALGVDGILEGSISRSGDQVHMNIQLIQAVSDTHVWAESYDRSSKDLPSLSREAALTIATRLNRSVPQPTAERYVKPEAHDAYLRGRYYWFTENSERDLEYLKKATELQPDYALAWSGLSAAYERSAIHGTGRFKDLAPLAEQSVRKALELDESLSDAHNSMAAYYLFMRWEPEEALKESDRAIQLDPQYAEAYFLRSNIFQSLNRLNDALEAEKRSTELDPLARPFSMPQLLTRMRNYDAAIREAQARVVGKPTDLNLLWELALAYQCKGMEEEAARETEKMVLLDGGEAEATSVRHAFERGGYRAILEMQLRDTKRRAAHQYVAPLEFAFAYANLRSKDEALDFLEQAYREHAPALVWIQNWPQWDFLHSDERYRSIVRRMGLPPAW